MDPVTAWEHPGFASSSATGSALAAVKADTSLADLVLWDEATGDTIIRAFGVGGAVKFQTSAGGAGGIAWSDVSKVGSSLLDLATRDASALNSGVLLSARLVGAYTGITSLGTLTTLTVTGLVTASAGIAVTGGTQAAGTIVRTSGSGTAITGVAGSAYDLALVNAAITDYLLVNPTGTADVRIALNGITLFGAATSKTGLAAGDIAVANGRRVGFRSAVSDAYLGLFADTVTDFMLNINTGATVGSGGYIRIPRFTVGTLPAASAAMDGTTLINATDHRFCYWSGGARYYLTGTPF